MPPLIEAATEPKLESFAGPHSDSFNLSVACIARKLDPKARTTVDAEIEEMLAASIVTMKPQAAASLDSLDLLGVGSVLAGEDGRTCPGRRSNES